MPSPAVLMAGLLFGTIGVAAIRYGWKTASWRPMVIGAALAVFPYFVAQAWLILAIGAALCAALYYWRE